MALSALCSDSEWGQTWRNVLQHRFQSDGPLNGHALGNLLIVSLWEQLGGSVPALEWVGQLLKIKGRVLPMSSMPLEIEAEVTCEGQHEVVRGQVAVATTTGHVDQLRLLPQDPPAQPEALEAIESADFVIFGPGSWYTSIIPHLLVPDLYRSLCTTGAKKILSLNLLAEKETRGLSVADHIRSFHAHAPDLRLDVILADPQVIDDRLSIERAAHECGARLLVRNVRMNDGTARHDPLRLAAAYRDAFDGV